MPASFVDGTLLPPADGDVEREQDGGGRVDRHRRRHAIERDAVEQRGHVFDRVDRDTDAADFTGGERMIRVVSHLRRQIERDAQAADAVGEQVAIAGVGLFRRAEPGVLTHRPQPAAVHRRLDAAREGKFAREPELGRRVPVDEVVRCAQLGRLGPGERSLRLYAAGRGCPSRRGRLIIAVAAEAILRGVTSNTR